MDTAWKDEFEPWIFARGRKYYEEGKVTIINQTGNLVLATVSGSEDYRVEMEFPGGVLDFIFGVWLKSIMLQLFLIWRL